jgi:hypothetical protein
MIEIVDLLSDDDAPGWGHRFNPAALSEDSSCVFVESAKQPDTASSKRKAADAGLDGAPAPSNDDLDGGEVKLVEEKVGVVRRHRCRKQHACNFHSLWHPCEAAGEASP